MPQYQRYVEKRGANHTLHLILTICTCGLWGIVWAIAAAMGRKTVTKVPIYTPPPQAMPPQQPYGYPPQQQYPPQQYGPPPGQQPGPYGPPPGPYPPQQ